MKRRSISIALTALLVLVGATQATHALASITALSYNNTSAQAVSTGNWKVVAAADSVTSTAAAYVAPSANFTSYTGTCGVQSGITLTFSNGASSATVTGGTSTLVAGTTVTGTGMRASTTITITNSTTIALSRTTNASSAGTYTFTDNSCFQQYFNVNNFGTITASTIGIGQTVTATLGNSVELQTCSATWTESTGACSGTITTFLTTRGVSPSASGYIANFGVSLASGGTSRIRAITTQSGIQTTITVVVSSASNVIAVPNMNV